MSEARMAAFAAHAAARDTNHDDACAAARTAGHAAGHAISRRCLRCCMLHCLS